ncbi:hypothetical protein [Amycolatopsis regifaucium]|uniref:Uncharacterized protein n=1 Tax=Amycolatopsis regifaucium TaxID=546365 RepID=A0A154MLI4_9PSEU|nr:hypothetical protein [Amycolatopsis regifaucium]KZB85208.1 hypothetical protein AVL48_03190 [Amycolatopsis regifaucium]OKA03815.1 hypothetical protein ATP06_0234440 [Amycolatopsis regifaucium]SFH90320.1 hypothetical protein SAMN04489731_10750 [Amycolatopsis regifaucium]
MGNLKRWPVLTGVGVLVGAAAWWIVDEMPSVDEAVAREALPGIDEHLRASTTAAARSGDPRIRWVCTQKVIETRPEGDLVNIGLVASCDEVAKEGDGLVTRSGFRRQPMVYRVERTPGGYRVLDRKFAEDGAGHSRSVKEMFSWIGARRVLDGASPDDPKSVSAAAFGLPESTPVRTGR